MAALILLLYGYAGTYNLHDIARRFILGFPEPELPSLPLAVRGIPSAGSRPVCRTHRSAEPLRLAFNILFFGCNALVPAEQRPGWYNQHPDSRVSPSCGLSRGFLPSFSIWQHVFRLDPGSKVSASVYLTDKCGASQPGLCRSRLWLSFAYQPGPCCGHSTLWP
jgi:hypothetical protein